MVVLAHSAALSARVRVTLRVPPGASVGHVCACYSSALNASAAERPAAEAVAEASTGSASWTPAACGFSVFASRQVATRGCGAAPPLAGWLLAAWLPACVTVTEYRIDAGLRQQNLVQMYAVVSSCTRLYRYTAVRRQQNCRRVDHFRRQMDHVIKTADESITSPKFT